MAGGAVAGKINLDDVSSRHFAGGFSLSSRKVRLGTPTRRGLLAFQPFAKGGLGLGTSLQPEFEYELGFEATFHHNLDPIFEASIGASFPEVGVSVQATLLGFAKGKIEGLKGTVPFSRRKRPLPCEAGLRRENWDSPP
jgi:hypothetical protein